MIHTVLPTDMMVDATSIVTDRGVLIALPATQKAEAG